MNESDKEIVKGLSESQKYLLEMIDKETDAEIKKLYLAEYRETSDDLTLLHSNNHKTQKNEIEKLKWQRKLEKSSKKQQ